MRAAAAASELPPTALDVAAAQVTGDGTPSRGTTRLALPSGAVTLLPRAVTMFRDVACQTDGGKARVSFSDDVQKGV